MARSTREGDLWPHSLLWYSQPASSFVEGGLPIGNGVLGAMVVAGLTRDRVALNHEWLWRGKGRSRDVEEKWQHLAEIRELFFAGKVLEAGTLANETLGGKGGVLEKKNRIDPYQPAGDLFVEMADGPVKDFRRELDLDRAVVTVSYRQGRARFRREYFAHATRPVVAIRLSGGGRAGFTALLRLGRIEDPECEITRSASGSGLGLSGRFVEGVRFAVEAKVVTDGQVAPGQADGTVSIRANKALVLLSVAVDLDDGDAAAAATEQIASVSGRWGPMLRSHVGAHRKLYRRVKLEIGEDRPDVPTDRRLADILSGQSDEGLLALYANFGRYLLISSSRAGDVPANLQGLWNEDLAPPWECDIHQDVNVQMNYWPAEPCGLGECTAPLFAHMERFVPHARQVARKLYHCRGIWMPIQTDPWGRATPESRGWDVWIGAAAWLVQHLWWRYEYSLDKRFLRRRAYPYLKEVAAFYEDYLVEHPEGKWLVAVPSQSPENRFVGGTAPVSLCVSASMDTELVHDVLSHAIAASEILGTDKRRRRKWQDILAQQPPLRIGRWGQLQEWLEDYEETEPGHRHISHLFALYPGDQITVADEPDLARAARVSLERRLAAKGGHTGWSRAWTVCCWARLREGDLAHEHLQRLVLDFATEALLDLHPPRIFQVEGNLGGTAGVCEMLLQSHRGLIRILPALPGAWPDGKVAGLRARGGFTVDIEWAAGRATRVGLHSARGADCRLHCTGVSKAGISRGGAPVEPRRISEDRLEFPTEAGKMYELKWQ